jgi:DNA-binding response OmpR family regulator
MATRTKVLVVDNDLDTLSKIYLALVHRNYKTEASDKVAEIAERIKRFKPSLLILGRNEYLSINNTLKIPAIVVGEKQELEEMTSESEVVFLPKPFSVEALVKAIQQLLI